MPRSRPRLLLTNVASHGLLHFRLAWLKIEKNVMATFMRFPRASLPSINSDLQTANGIVEILPQMPEFSLNSSTIGALQSRVLFRAAPICAWIVCSAPPSSPLVSSYLFAAMFCLLLLCGNRTFRASGVPSVQDRDVQGMCLREEASILVRGMMRYDTIR